MAAKPLTTRVILIDGNRLRVEDCDGNAEEYEIDCGCGSPGGGGGEIPDQGKTQCWKEGVMANDFIEFYAGFLEAVCPYVFTPTDPLMVAAIMAWMVANGIPVTLYPALFHFAAFQLPAWAANSCALSNSMPKIVIANTIHCTWYEDVIDDAFILRWRGAMQSGEVFDASSEAEQYWMLGASIFVGIFDTNFWFSRFFATLSDTDQPDYADCEEYVACTPSGSLSCEEFSLDANFPFSGNDFEFVQLFGNTSEFPNDDIVNIEPAQTVVATRTERAWEVTSKCLSGQPCQTVAISRSFSTPISICSLQVFVSIYLNAPNDTVRQGANSSRYAVYYRQVGDPDLKVLFGNTQGIWSPYPRQYRYNAEMITNVTEIIVAHRAGGSYGAIDRVLINLPPATV